jgi:hypothetical protein
MANAHLFLVINGAEADVETALIAISKGKNKIKSIRILQDRDGIDDRPMIQMVVNNFLVCNFSIVLYCDHLPLVFGRSVAACCSPWTLPGVHELAKS